MHKKEVVAAFRVTLPPTFDGPVRRACHVAAQSLLAEDHALPFASEITIARPSMRPRNATPVVGP